MVEDHTKWTNYPETFSDTAVDIQNSYLRICRGTFNGGRKMPVKDRQQEYGNWNRPHPESTSQPAMLFPNANHPT